MKYCFTIALLISIVIFSSCKKDKVEEPVDMKKEYYPIETGLYIDYEVDSIHWNSFTTPTTIDSFTYKMRIRIDSAYIDNSGRKANIVQRFIYNSSLLEWQLSDVSTVLQTSSGIERFDNNVRYLKLVWPVKLNKSWNPNVYNIFAALDATYSEVDVPKTIQNSVFDSCTVVQLEDSKSLIKEDTDYEIYAKNVGLVHRKIAHVETSVSGIIKDGYKYELNYITHGKN